MGRQEQSAWVALALIILVVMACNPSSVSASVILPSLAIGFLAGFGVGLRVGINNPVTGRIVDDGSDGDD